MNKTTDRKYSGRFVLRIATDLHESLAELATDQGVSLNHYLQNLLSSHVGGVTTAEYAYHQAQASSLAKMEKYSAIYLQALERQMSAKKTVDSISGEHRS